MFIHKFKMHEDNIDNILLDKIPIVEKFSGISTLTLKRCLIVPIFIMGYDASGGILRSSYCDES